MLALFILVKPAIQVKAIIDTAPTDLNERHVQFGKQRHPDTEVTRRLLPGQATQRRQRQVVFVHVTRRPMPCDSAALPAP